MKESIMEIIVCPVCKGTLDLKVTEKTDVEIIAGSLFCARCDYTYSIKDSIPNLLPPETNT
jgi:uncharacterized protein YbaR (Trm112 family)